MVGAWDDVQSLVERVGTQTSSTVMARLLLAMRSGEATAISESMSVARSVLGAPITAAGVKGYRRSYEAVLDLHLTHELELIHQVTSNLPVGSQGNRQQARRQAISELSRTLSARLNATLPTFRSREPILSMRRTAFALSYVTSLHDSERLLTILRCVKVQTLVSASIAKLDGHGLLVPKLQERPNNGRLHIVLCFRPNRAKRHFLS